MKLGEAITRFFTPGRNIMAADSTSSRKQMRNKFANTMLLNILDSAEADSFEPYKRCVDLVTGEAARIISETVTVVDANGVPSRSRRSRRAVDMLRSSLDGGLTSSYQGILDLLYDVATEGNAFASPLYDSNGNVEGLRRLRPGSVTWIQTSRGSGYFRGSYEDNQMMESFSPRELIHARWTASKDSSGRGRFSPAPEKMLENSIKIGSAAELAILKEYLLGPESRSIITAAPAVHTIAGAKSDMASQETLAKNASERKFGEVNVIKRAAIYHGLPETPVEKQQLKIIQQQVGVICGFYGAPVTLVMNMGATATNEDFKNLRRIGIRALTHKFLSALQLRLLAGTGNHFSVQTHSWDLEDADGIAALIEKARPNTGVAPVMTLDEIRRMLKLGPATPEIQDQLREFQELGAMVESVE